jgi:hypothetical protein
VFFEPGVPSMAKLNFKDVIICREERFSVGVEESSGKFYVAIPVSNSLVDYEEYYQIDQDAFARYTADPKAALSFVRRCRNREADEHLILNPGKKRGIPL